MVGKILVSFLLSALLLLAGCASKGYVDKKMAEMQAQVGTDVSSIKAQTDSNSDEIKRIQALTTELSGKTDMALNKAKGFEDYQVIWEGMVNFDYDSHELTQIAQDNLDALGQKMADNPRSILEIAGHTDRTGSAKYNFQLGLRRSESVKTFLADKYGVALYRMFIVSFGENKPIAMPDEANTNAKNRRVVLKLWGPM